MVWNCLSVLSLWLIVVKGAFFDPYCGAWCKMAALPLPVAILDGLISGSRKWGHPRWRPEAEGPPFCTTHRIRDRKTRPKSWMTSFPVSPSWIQDGNGGNDIWRTSRRPWRRSTDVCPIHESCRPVEVWLYLDLKSIWSLASPRHYPSDWVSCPLATTGKWSVCTCRKL